MSDVRSPSIEAMTRLLVGSTIVLGAAMAALFMVACGDDDAPPPAAPPEDAGEAGAPVEAGEVDAGPWPSTVVTTLTNPCGLYYSAPIEVGAQTFNAFLDTGSTTLAVASKDCPACADAGVHNIYAPGPDAVDTHEGTASAYVDGSSWSGEVYIDDVHVPGSKPKVPTKIVAISGAENGFFVSGLAAGAMPTPECTGVPNDGIFGLGPSVALAPGTESVVDQLVVAGMPDIYAVQLCEGTGKLWFGGFDRSVGTADPTYSPLVHVAYSRKGPSTIGYSVDVADMQIGGKSVATSTSFGSAVLDTGTTDLVLPKEVFNGMVAAVTASDGWKSVFASNPVFSPPTCYEIDKTTAEIDSALPHISVMLKSGATLDLPPTGSYLQAFTKKEKPIYCPAIRDGGAIVEPGAKIIFGDAMLRSYVTIFDRAQQRAGFMPFKHDAACP